MLSTEAHKAAFVLFVRRLVHTGAPHTLREQICEQYKEGIIEWPKRTAAVLHVRRSLSLYVMDVCKKAVP